MIKKEKFRISEFIDFLESIKSEKGDIVIFYKNLPFLYYNFLTEAKDKSSLNERENFENIPKIFYEIKELKND